MVTKKIAVLTGGGDCPGLNAVIRAIVRKSLGNSYEVLGLLDGWQGLLEKRYKKLDYPSVSGILHIGGTILGTSRTNLLKDEGTIQLAFQRFKELDLHGLIAIGGEGTLSVSAKMFERGLNVIGVPKTIDNDISETDYTFGFDTAVQIATEAIDRLHTTAESHKRAMVVEVMGRHAGWIAAHAGIAGGADAIVIPEFPMSIEEICQIIERRRERGKLYSIIVVAEGAKLSKDGTLLSIHKNRTDDFGRHQLGGIGQALADQIEKATGIEVRVTVLGHIQRGGTPTAHDRVLATRFGTKAVELAHQEKWGYMPALKGSEIVEVPLALAVKKLKTVPQSFWDFVHEFSG
ncbi:MAG: 6-phosphofructokinase [Proteobacteria bacterium]|nr:6-phosphofructokinase [Pseudomonadota bacterium]